MNEKQLLHFSDLPLKVHNWKENKDFASKAELIRIVIFLYNDGKGKKPEFETICFFALITSKRNLTSCRNV